MSHHITPFVPHANTVGKGEGWTEQESLHLAECWIAKSEEEGASNLRGANQNSQTFWAGVKSPMEHKSPNPNPDGVYHDRAWTAIRNHWRDQVSRDAKKFNEALQKAHASCATGCTEENKINVAVAVYVGKCNAMMCRHKDFVARSWKFFLCWKRLKSHPAFLPPSPPASASHSSDGEAEEEEWNTDDLPEATSADGVAEENDSQRTLFTTPGGSDALRARSRGPGPGAKKTKAEASKDEHRKKKAKVQEGCLAVQQGRQPDFKLMVSNHARQQAFKMAVLGHITFKDDNPDEAEKCKQTMHNILSNNTTANEDEDLPPLEGNHGASGV